MSNVPRDREKMRLVLIAIEWKIAHQPDMSSLHNLSEWIQELNELGEEYCQAGGTMPELEERFNTRVLIVEKGPPL